jgi:hypothetical protein
VVEVAVLQLLQVLQVEVVIQAHLRLLLVVMRQLDTAVEAVVLLQQLVALAELVYLVVAVAQPLVLLAHEQEALAAEV